MLALYADSAPLCVLFGILLALSFACYCGAASRVIGRDRALRRRAAVLRRLWNAQPGIGADESAVLR